MLAPIYQLLFGKHDDELYSKRSLELTEDQIRITYKTYKADSHADMQEIIDQKLAPGKKFRPSIIIQ